MSLLIVFLHHKVLYTYIDIYTYIKTQQNVPARCILIECPCSLYLHHNVIYDICMLNLILVYLHHKTLYENSVENSIVSLLIVFLHHKILHILIYIHKLKFSRMCLLVAYLHHMTLYIIYLCLYLCLLYIYIYIFVYYYYDYHTERKYSIEFQHDRIFYDT